MERREREAVYWSFRKKRKSAERYQGEGKEVNKKRVGCFGVASSEPLLVSWPFPCMVCIVSKVAHELCNHNFDIFINGDFFLFNGYCFFLILQVICTMLVYL